MQPALQACGSEGVRNVLFHDMLVPKRLQRWLELAAGLPWPEHGVRRARNMPYVDDGALGLPPCAQQGLHLQLGIGIVPSPQFGVVHALLHVDDQQCCVRIQRFHEISPSRVSARPKSWSPMLPSLAGAINHRL